MDTLLQIENVLIMMLPTLVSIPAMYFLARWKFLTIPDLIISHTSYAKYIELGDGRYAVRFRVSVLNNNKNIAYIEKITIGNVSFPLNNNKEVIKEIETKKGLITFRCNRINVVSLKPGSRIDGEGKGLLEGCIVLNKLPKNIKIAIKTPHRTFKWKIVELIEAEGIGMVFLKDVVPRTRGVRSTIND